MGQNFLKRIMSQLLDNTKKMTKNREKNQNNQFLGLKIFEFLTPKKLTKNREKNRKLFSAQNCLNQLLDNTKKRQKIEKKKSKNSFLGQNCLKIF